MSMKSTNSPRRVYCRNEVYHVLYAGTTFGTKETVLRLDLPVKIEGQGDGTIKLTQRAPKKKGVTEVWSPIVVPCKARKAS